MGTQLIVVGDSQVYMQGRDLLCRPVPIAEASSSLTLSSSAMACLQNAARGVSHFDDLRRHPAALLRRLCCTVAGMVFEVHIWDAMIAAQISIALLV